MNLLETDFLNDLKNHSYGLISIGQPNSGKSYMMLSYVKYALYNNIYDSIHLVLPQYCTEESDSYGFLKNYKKKVFIYTKYNELISLKLLSQNNSEKKKKIFYAIDDATGSLFKSLDKSLIQLYTISRHINITTWLIAHGSKSVFAKLLRGIVKFIFVYSLESSKILQDIYEDFFSLQYESEGKKYKDFIKIYNEKVINIKYGSILIMRQNSTDYDVIKWKLLKFKFPKKEELNKESKDDKEKKVELKKDINKNIISFF